MLGSFSKLVLFVIIVKWGFPKKDVNVLLPWEFHVINTWIYSKSRLKTEVTLTLVTKGSLDEPMVMYERFEW